MEREAATKLKNLGIPEGYRAFDYLCSLLCRYGVRDVTNLTMQRLIAELAEEFGVSKKAVFHNFELLIKRTWEYETARANLGHYEYPTVKEFVFGIIVLSGESA